MIATPATRRGRQARPPSLPAAHPQRRAGTTTAALERELEKLHALDRTQLVERFEKLCGFRPPPRFSRKLMTLAVAYKMQEKMYGGLKPATRRFLLEAADPAVKPGRASQAQLRFKTGTILLREWQGVTHQVTVLEAGFLFREKHYGSLSEIACLITGAHWSGPAFFAVKKLAAEAKA